MGAIIYGFVPRPEGQAALERAIEEAVARGFKLVVLHSARGGRSEDIDELVQHRESFELLAERLSSLGVDHELREFVRGRTVPEDVLGAADEYDADLIVIGLRQRTAVGKLLLGSIAQDILLGSPCPVLAVPAAE